MEGVMAVVTSVGYDFTPKNWGACNGQLLSIAQNQALFSLLGTTYGGNGVTTFGLPDLRGRVAVGTGQGLSYYTLGEVTGAETVTLNMSNLPPHNHNGQITIVPKGGNSNDAPSVVGGYPAGITNGYASAATAGTTMLPPTYSNLAVGQAGSSQPVPILTPYLTINFVICMYGIFPSRN